MVSAEIAVVIIPYSPDLAPSDFFLFPKMKEHLAGKRFSNDEDLKDSVVTWLYNLAATWYEEGIHKLVPKYDTCLNCYCCCSWVLRRSLASQVIIVASTKSVESSTNFAQRL